jgi:dienelactone hydrolase
MTGQDREALRLRLATALGGHSATAFSIEDRRPIACGLIDTRVEQLQLSRADGSPVRAYLTGPVAAWATLPAVLYIHAHGHRYDIGAAELIDGRPAILNPPYGQALAQAGHVTLCIDLPCFGEQSSTTESALSKRYLWQGGTLFGAMIDDLAGGVAVLQAIDGVDPKRIGAFGLSMGATLAYWLAALDTRIQAVAHLCCFADLGTLVDSGAHDLHGPYLTVPGLLNIAATGRIAGLAAPRPQLACMGALDPLTPPLAVERAVSEAQAAYVSAGAADAFDVLLSADTGHAETPAMREAVLMFLDRHLKR